MFSIHCKRKKARDGGRVGQQSYFRDSKAAIIYSVGRAQNETLINLIRLHEKILKPRSKPGAFFPFHNIFTSINRLVMHVRPWDGGLLRQMLQVNEFFTAQIQSFRCPFGSKVCTANSFRDSFFNGKLHWFDGLRLMRSDVTTEAKLCRHQDVILFIIVV